MIFRALAALSSLPSARCGVERVSPIGMSASATIPRDGNTSQSDGYRGIPKPDPAARERVRRDSISIATIGYRAGLARQPDEGFTEFFPRLRAHEGRVSKLRGVLVGAGLTADNPRLTALASELGISNLSGSWAARRYRGI